MEVVKTFVDLIGNAKWEQLEQWDKYHRGEFEPPYLPSVNRSMLAQEYQDLLSRADLNICALIVSAVVDRLQIEGIRSTGTGQNDDTVWQWLQSSNFDARQTLLYRDAMIFGSGFLSVVPNGDMPKFSAESPLNLSVKYDPTDPTKVLLGAKTVDDYGWLYTDEVIYALRRSTKDWERGWVVVEETPHNAGATPLVRFPNRLDSRGRDMSEISLIASPQRRILQTIADRLLVQRAASWRQRYISGISIEQDEEGNAIPPFRVGVDQIVVSENPDARFGEWSESPFDAHLRAVEDDIRQAAAVSQTPPHLLAPHTISNISAEALVALEAGLAAKVQERQLQWGEAIEYAARLGGNIVGYEIADDAEVLWADLERRSDAQRVDGALKLRSMGLPMEFLLERLGLTPQAIKRVMDASAKEQATAAATSAAAFGMAPSQAPIGAGSANGAP
jgi:hypothetical protein